MKNWFFPSIEVKTSSKVLNFVWEYLTVSYLDWDIVGHSKAKKEFCSMSCLRQCPVKSSRQDAVFSHKIHLLCQRFLFRLYDQSKHEVVLFWFQSQFESVANLVERWMMTERFPTSYCWTRPTRLSFTVSSCVCVHGSRVGRQHVCFGAAALLWVCAWRETGVNRNRRAAHRIKGKTLWSFRAEQTFVRMELLFDVFFGPFLGFLQSLLSGLLQTFWPLTSIRESHLLGVCFVLTYFPDSGISRGRFEFQILGKILPIFFSRICKLRPLDSL